jgi:uncharacterized membrane protein
MALIGKLHPLFVHFPIALIIAAAAAELVDVATRRHAWHTVAVANLRAGAATGVVTAVTGWVLEDSIGLAGAVGALSSYRHVPSGRSVFVYRVALFGTAFLVAISGHLGGMLVWGAESFRP